MDMDVIRQAILKNRGGLKKATDNELMTIWNSLEKETQQKYLESVKKKGAKTNAADSGAKSGI